MVATVVIASLISRYPAFCMPSGLESTPAQILNPDLTATHRPVIESIRNSAQTHTKHQVCRRNPQRGRGTTLSRSVRCIRGGSDRDRPEGRAAV
ncbi:hypothetical protein GGR57DRAFT_94347 [Xylariaceae sp. FL1272]|nr:hypothetical protein GGR57DRAFT_94347 [Xylariaceae sp. FL1272]